MTAHVEMVIGCLAALQGHMAQAGWSPCIGAGYGGQGEARMT